MFGIYDENDVLLIGGFPTFDSADNYTDELIGQRDKAGLPSIFYCVMKEDNDKT